MSSLPPKQHRQKILLISRDRSLLRTRGLVLQSTRAWVTRRAPQEGAALLRSRFFHIVVLCHTLSLRESVAISKESKLFWPLTRIVVILRSEDQEAPACEIDSAVPWTQGPARLVEVIRGMHPSGSSHTKSLQQPSLSDGNWAPAL